MQSISAKEAALLARRLCLPFPPPPLPSAPRRSINQLAEGFVVGLQQAIPSAVATITKTAGKLQGFEWTAPPTTSTPRQHVADADDEPLLCAVCTAPLHASEKIWVCRSCMLGLFAGCVGGDEEGAAVLAARVADAVRLPDTWERVSPAVLRQQVEAYLL